MNNKNVTFSILIATYNAATTLQRCLDSIWEQNYSSYEVIVIDGDSTDGTKQILKTNLNKPLTYVSEKDNGITDAWNKGLIMSSGEWILFLGGDDYLYSKNVLKQVTQFKSSKENILLGNIYYVNENGKPLQLINSNYNFNDFRRKMSIPHQGIFHNRALFDELGSYDLDYKLCADYEFLLRKKNELSVRKIDVLVTNMQVGGLSQSLLNKVWEEWAKAQIKNSANPLILIKTIMHYRYLKHYLFMVKNKRKFLK